MTATIDHSSGLSGRMTGDVVLPGDADYDDARRRWNGTVDRRPAVIARCRDAADVAAAITYARSEGLEIAVRGGGHSIPGHSVVDDGLVVDLSAMNSVQVDPATRRARVGGGALLSEMDAATQEYGLAVPCGQIGHTGVGGLTLGGGFGWLTRMAGLSVDAMRGAEVVLADGRTVHASADENPDLFWALRGGGGNFGVVTEFEFECYPVGPMVSIGMLFYGLDDAAAVLRLARETVPTLPPSVTFQVIAMNAPPEPFVPEAVRFRPGYALVVIGMGDPGGADTDADAVCESLRAGGPPPLFDFRSPMPYVALQQMIDEPNAWGVHCYDKSCFLTELSDPIIEVVTEHVARKQSPLSVVNVLTADGAYCDADGDATSFGGERTPRLLVFIIGLTLPDGVGFEAERDWVRAFHTALMPLAITDAIYVNAMGSGDGHGVSALYGRKYERLARIKAEVDPENVFHRNANILPAP
ncbi:FAD-binding oxidoreductase [Pseudonocardia endophytica]|uniref:FAD/FMN-containing dehydrogenase n=1 Tax=Pseudonocardia endophytica TaxID=401976 RepID=A0A4R1HY07_PSEEN|nr:FAD-binding oxidoreductase [Pseudonocardia endophytica]TCK24959.1 FAD/FMN-containing dehydrogenase [Pseudonocardia endophytica]